MIEKRFIPSERNVRSREKADLCSKMRFLDVEDPMEIEMIDSMMMMHSVECHLVSCFDCV